MDLAVEIQTAVKGGNVVIGFRDCVKAMKNENPKMVVVANNIPQEMKREIETSIKSGKTKMEIFNGSSRDLGVICGKPFSISALIIRD